MWKFYLFKNNDLEHPVVVPLGQAKYFNVFKDYLKSLDISSLLDKENGNRYSFLENREIDKKNIPFLFSATCSNNRDLLNKAIELYNSTRKKGKLNPSDFSFASLMCSHKQAEGYNFLRFVTPEIRKHEAYGIKTDKKEDKLVPLVYKEDLKMGYASESHLDFDSLITPHYASNNVAVRLDRSMNDIRRVKQMGYNDNPYEIDKYIEPLWNALLDMYYPKYRKVYSSAQSFTSKITDKNYVPDSKATCDELKNIMADDIVEPSLNRNVASLYHYGFVLTYIELKRLYDVETKLGREFDFDITKVKMEERAFAAIYTRDELYNHILRYPKGKYTITDFKKLPKETPIEQLIAEDERKKQDELNKINEKEHYNFTLEDLLNTKDIDDLFNIPEEEVKEEKTEKPAKKEAKAEVKEEKVEEKVEKKTTKKETNKEEKKVYDTTPFNIIDYLAQETIKYLVKDINYVNEQNGTSYTLNDYLFDPNIKKFIDMQIGLYDYDEEEGKGSR